MKFRSAYNLAPREASVGLACRDPSLAVQSQKDEADINTLIKRFGLSGTMPQNVRVPLLDDFDEAFDFQSAMNAVRLASESFGKMPADIRDRFRNDPHLFVEFCTDLTDDGKALRNLEEMRKMGLAVPAAVSPPVVPATP